MKLCIWILLIFGLRPAFATDLEADSLRMLKGFETSKMNPPAETLPRAAAALDKRVTSLDFSLSRSELKENLSSTQRVSIEHPLIKSLAKALTKNSKTDLEKVLVIHNFVLWRLTHIARFEAPLATPESLGTQKGKLVTCLKARQWNYEGFRACGINQRQAQESSRGGFALSALYLGIANCTGYASLFEALSRAAGVPARIAFTPRPIDPDRPSFHFWNQVYLNGQWVVIDTTFDDSSDNGSTEDQALEQNNFAYSFMTPEQAAELEPSYKEYELGNKYGF